MCGFDLVGGLEKYDLEGMMLLSSRLICNLMASRWVSRVFDFILKIIDATKPIPS